MASKMRVTLAGTCLTWADRTSGQVLFQFDGNDVPSALFQRVYMHGIKQIIGDAAALPAGTSTRDRITAMFKAAESLTTGSYGTRVSSMPAYDTFRALVALGRLVDSATVREKWGKLTDTQRSALGDSDDVREWVRDNVTADVDTDDVLADLMS